jgi:mRNA interferase RelE/StbE
LTYTIGWKEAAVAMFWRLRAQDPQAAIAVALAVASLTDEPRPATSRPLGGTEFLRMRIGTYRVLYEIDEARFAIVIHSVGRTPAGS